MILKGYQYHQGINDFKCSGQSSMDWPGGPTDHWSASDDSWPNKFLSIFSSTQLINNSREDLSLSLKLTPYIFPPFSLFIYFYLSFCPKHTITKCGIEVARELSVVLAMDEKESFCRRHVRDPCHAFRRRCGRLVKEQRARFYILRRCVTMLICWRECHDPWHTNLNL